MSDRLLVLGWHNVESTACFPSLRGAGLAGLRRQLTVLARVATVVPLFEALETLAAGRALPPRAVALTFDDGYADNLTLAAPLLTRLGLPATFFLVPGLLSRTVPPWWEIAGWAFARTSSPTIRWNGASYSLRDSRARQQAFLAAAEMLKRRDRAACAAAVDGLVRLLAPAGDPPPPELFLDWDGARQLVRAGFEVGSHGYDHAILAEESPEEQERDLLRSRRDLEAGVGAPVRLLAYPNGTRRDYDRNTVRLARRAGYAAAVTTLPGLNRPDTPLLETRRVVVYPERGLREIVAVSAHLARARRRAAG